jgi:hypothetical protein
MATFKEIYNKRPELQNQKYRYAEHVLKSAGSVAQSNFPRNINLGIKEN